MYFRFCGWRGAAGNLRPIVKCRDYPAWVQSYSLGGSSDEASWLGVYCGNLFPQSASIAIDAVGYRLYRNGWTQESCIHHRTITRGFQLVAFMITSLWNLNGVALNGRWSRVHVSVGCPFVRLFVCPVDRHLPLAENWALAADIDRYLHGHPSCGCSLSHWASTFVYSTMHARQRIPRVDLMQLKLFCFL